MDDIGFIPRLQQFGATSRLPRSCSPSPVQSLFCLFYLKYQAWHEAGSPAGPSKRLVAFFAIGSVILHLRLPILVEKKISVSAVTVAPELLVTCKFEATSPPLSTAHGSFTCLPRSILTCGVALVAKVNAIINPRTKVAISDLLFIEILLVP